MIPRSLELTAIMAKLATVRWGAATSTHLSAHDSRVLLNALESGTNYMITHAEWESWKAPERRG